MFFPGMLCGWLMGLVFGVLIGRMHGRAVGYADLQERYEEAEQMLQEARVTLAIAQARAPQAAADGAAGD